MSLAPDREERMRTMGWMGLAMALTMALGVLPGCTVCCTVHECCSPAARNPQKQIGIDIPDAVHAGVLKVLPGFVATEVEIEEKNGVVVYEFEGTSEGGRYEIEVDGDGNVLQIDQEVAEDGNEGGDED